MTTNGYLLGNFIPKLKGAVDHVNISRHAIKDQDNEAIFGTKSVPDTETLAQLIFDLNKQGIDATLNVVLPSLEAPSETFLDDWSDFAKVIGASGVAFRIDHSLGLENLHADDISLKASGFTYQESSCPVCLTHTYRYRGAPMMFKYGISEPSDIQPYELVMQQNSDLTLDWAGKLPYNLEKDERIKPKKITYPAPTTGSLGGIGSRNELGWLKSFKWPHSSPVRVGPPVVRAAGPPVVRVAADRAVTAPIPPAVRAAPNMPTWIRCPFYALALVAMLCLLYE